MESRRKKRMQKRWVAIYTYDETFMYAIKILNKIFNWSISNRLELKGPYWNWRKCISHAMCTQEITYPVSMCSQYRSTTVHFIKCVDCDRDYRRHSSQTEPSHQKLLLGKDVIILHFANILESYMVGKIKFGFKKRLSQTKKLEKGGMPNCDMVIKLCHLTCWFYTENKLKITVNLLFSRMEMNVKKDMKIHRIFSANKTSTVLWPQNN